MDSLQYDKMVESALRSVVTQAIEAVVEHGLPGDHHFYITFDTKADGVDIPKFLHAQYPEEMTVVLQHQFWDLFIDDKHFEVTLSFAGAPQRLSIPLASVTSFFDPSVQFGLRFGDGDGAGDEGVILPLGEEGLQDEDGSHGAAGPDPDATDADTADEDAAEEKTGEVVNLDAFRKKT